MDDTEARLKHLMLSGLEGDAGAHRQLLALLSERLRAYFARRLPSGAADVEDLVQETLLAVHLRRASYDTSLAFSPWALAIARYKMIDHWRRQGRRTTVPIDDMADFLSAEAPQTDDGLDLTRALGALPVSQRTLIEDVKVSGLSLREAGAKAGVSEGAAKVALHRALRALAGRMRRADA